MIEAQVTAREIRRRLMNPPNGRVSSDIEVKSKSGIRKLAIDVARRRDAELRDQRMAERAAEIEAAMQANEIAREQAMLAATPDGEAVPKIPKFTDVTKAVCNHFNVTHVDLISSRRTKDIVRPRQVLMYLARRLTPMSLPQIAYRLGGRDHTTALHATNKIAALLAFGDERLIADIAAIKAALGVE